jgi:two-component system response regulator AlgR
LRLRQLLAQCPQPATLVVGEAAHARQAIESLAVQPCDAVLLDIRMPGQDGLQLAQALRQGPLPPAVVFVTAHESHAREAFDLEAVDYLTKPVQRERLEQALRRVSAYREARGGAVIAANAAPPAEVLVIQERQRTLRIPLAEIVMARAGDKLVTLSTLSRDHVLDESLAELHQRLGSGFLRVHRSVLVAAHAIRELQHRPLSGAGDDSWALRLAPRDQWVPVSRRSLATVRRALESA